VVINLVMDDKKCSENNSDIATKDGGEATKNEKKDANVCMALGAGVGTLGAISAAITGAVCPLCIFVAPGLLGVGAYKRWKASKK
jgi:hypothetical protein